MTRNSSALRARIRPGAIFCFGILALWSFGVSTAADPAPAAPTTQPVVKEAQDGPVKLSVTLDRDSLALSDQLHMKLRIEAEGGLQLQVPEFKDVLGDFLIKDAPPATSQHSDAAGSFEQTYVLVPAVPGAASIPEISVKYTDSRERADGSKGSSEGTVKIDAIKIQVAANLADVKGPVSLPWGGLSPVWWWIIGVVSAALLIALIARIIHRRRMGRVAAPLVVADPPHIWAIKQLEKLLALRLVERGEVQEFYYRINSLVREYIERRFAVNAGEQTSEEFIRSLQHSHQLTHPHKLMLRHFVDACDPVKYARKQPQNEDVQWVQTAARQFFVESAPRPAELEKQESNVEVGVAA